MQDLHPASQLEKDAWPVLSDSIVDVIQAQGEKRILKKGEILFDIGQLDYELAYIEDGTLNIVDRTIRKKIVSIEKGSFTGELGMLMGQKAFLAVIAETDCTLVTIPTKKLRHIIDTVPDLGDIIVTAFAARRRLLLDRQAGGLIIVGKNENKSTLRLREFAKRSQIPSRFVDADDTEEVAEISQWCKLPETETAVVLGDSKVLVSPTIQELAEAIGLDLVNDNDTLFDVLIIGAGPAGLAASIYGASEGLNVLIIEDTAIGGQAGTSSRIENYFGFPKGISGTDLAYRGEVQAIKFGARLTVPRRATKLKITPDHFELELDTNTCVRGSAIIMANGIQYRRLPLKGLERLEGSGIYYAATELESRYCQNSNVVVVGGGNSAGQAAMFLSKNAKRVYVVIRGDGLAATMSSYLSDRIVNSPKIELITQSEINALEGAESLTGLTLTNNSTEEEMHIDTNALFIMIGAKPNTDWLDDQLMLDEDGFIKTGTDSEEGRQGFETSVPGIFAVGDIRSGSVKRVASAVGEGSVVISQIHQFLTDEI